MLGCIEPIFASTQSLPSQQGLRWQRTGKRKQSSRGRRGRGGDVALRLLQRAPPQPREPVNGPAGQLPFFIILWQHCGKISLGCIATDICK